MPIDKKNPAPGSIPIRTSYINVYVFKRFADGPKFLILKRKSRYMYGLWQQVAGKVEEGENGAAAALREIDEETGNYPKYLYSADIVEIFYDIAHSCIHIVPVFVAEFPVRSRVVLSPEHSECKWVTSDEAKKYLPFAQQKESIDTIDREFIDKEPPWQLRIEF
jgi:dihydroneopterin triphosphate diphosphatase